jgi:two-component system, chemotaxis family, chemotaxis protein CheY
MLNKVMVVDDSLLMHRMYDIIFMRYKGVKVVHAKDGQEALDLLRANPDTDLVVLDINMPVMNGLEFLARLRSDRIYADVPVVIVTTEDKESETLQGLENGARGYVKKPFHPTALHTLIEQIFKVPT